jgi:hypothetical protein
MQKIPRRDNNGINKYRKKNMYPKAKKDKPLIKT